MSATCGHVSCARREHLVAVLIKAGLDAKRELSSLRSDRKLTAEDFFRMDAVVTRLDDAILQLQPRKVIDCKRRDGGVDCNSFNGCSGCHNAIYEEQVPA